MEVEEKRQEDYAKEVAWSKSRLEALEKKQKSIWVYIAFFLIGAIITTVLLYVRYTDTLVYKLHSIDIIISVASGVFIVLILMVYWNLSIDILKTKYKRTVVSEELQHINEKVEEDIFENSIRMSYKYLDEYYLQTREQAQKGFIVTISVSIGGAIILAIGIFAMFTGITDPAYITIASGVITEFVAAIFFYLYNRTIQSMGSYHNKLVLSQNVSIALKLSDSLEKENQDIAKMEIMRELIKDINNKMVTKE